MKERYQNPTLNEQLKLRLFTYNSNNLSDVYSIEQVAIYTKDSTIATEENPEGWRIVQTVSGEAVVQNDEGDYSLVIETTSPLYTIGNYKDVWKIVVQDGEEPFEVSNLFSIYPQQWYTSPTPIVFDFNFHFQPNKFRKGSIQFLIIEIKPNVPRASDLQRYYENLAIVSDLKISIEQTCGPCVPQESDLRLIVEDQLVDYREKRYGYYQLDTTDLDCGIYNVWFKLEFGGNVYISDKMQLQIY